MIRGEKPGLLFFIDVIETIRMELMGVGRTVASRGYPWRAGVLHNHEKNLLADRKEIELEVASCACCWCGGLCP